MRKEQFAEGITVLPASNKDTLPKTSRQGGMLLGVKERFDYHIAYPLHVLRTNPREAFSHLRKHKFDIGLATTAVFAANQPAFASVAEAQESVLPAGLTLLHGDASRLGVMNRLNILLLDWNGTTPKMLQSVAKATFVIPPTDQFKDKVNLIHKRPEENLKCDQTGICDWDAINKEVDKVTKLGIPIQTSLTVVKSDDPYAGNGKSHVPSRSIPPTNRNVSVIVEPEIIHESEEMLIGDIAHELMGHGVAGYTHEGGGVMERKSNTFNEKQTQDLLALSKLWPFNYEMSALKRKLQTQSVEPVQLPTLDMPVQADMPAGTVWTKLIVEQQEGPAVTLIIGDAATQDSIRKGEYKIPAPKVGEGSYITRPNQIIKQKMWFSNKQDGMPDWESSEWSNYKAWPELIVPSASVEKTFRTPDVSPNTIKPEFPLPGSFIQAGSIALKWTDAGAGYYYRLQVSGDPTFNQDPATATSSVWDNRLHGGEANPLNSWKTPRLELGTYHVRMSHAAMSGQPETWGETWSFTVK